MDISSGLAVEVDLAVTRASDPDLEDYETVALSDDNGEDE